jgi:hypothetical protein
LAMAQAVIHQMGALPLDVISELGHRGAQPLGSEHILRALREPDPERVGSVAN